MTAAATAQAAATPAATGTPTTAATVSLGGGKFCAETSFWFRPAVELVTRDTKKDRDRINYASVTAFHLVLCDNPAAAAVDGIAFNPLLWELYSFGCQSGRLTTCWSDL